MAGKKLCFRKMSTQRPSIFQDDDPQNIESTILYVNPPNVDSIGRHNQTFTQQNVDSTKCRKPIVD